MMKLTERWSTLLYHKEQARLWQDESRFRVVPAGRRSGKTELAKRFGVMQAMSWTHSPDGWFVFAAPTHRQAKRIFWRDLKALIPREMIAGKPRESEMTIALKNGAEISVLGMDAPDRIEGRPLDWICCDEYANMKPEVWTQNLRPALSTLGRPGGAWMIGVPEGRNHYYGLAVEAQKPSMDDWSYHTWKSASILAPEEIAAAKRDLDEQTFAQEYEASFVNFQGRAYYGFERSKHCEVIAYNPTKPLCFCFDFNVSPGIAVVVQEHHYKGKKDKAADMVTAAIGEVHIPRNSNTPAVCRRLIADWKHHQGDVLCYGDATGGAKGTAKVAGSDWDLIRAELKPVFGERLKFRVPRANPRERVRVNAMNARIKAADGTIGLLVNQEAAPFLVQDLEGVILLAGGSGEIDKKSTPQLTHLTDALGYYVERVHPSTQRIVTISAV
jgi:hypothetical protein